MLAFYPRQARDSHSSPAHVGIAVAAGFHVRVAAGLEALAGGFALRIGEHLGERFRIQIAYRLKAAKILAADQNRSVAIHDQIFEYLRGAADRLRIERERAERFGTFAAAVAQRIEDDIV